MDSPAITPLHRLQQVGADRPVVFELLAAIVGTNAGPGADVLMAGPLVGILVSTPPADVLDQDSREVGLAGVNFRRQPLKYLTAVEPEPAPARISEDTEDFEASR